MTATGWALTQPLGNAQQASLLRLNVGTGYQYWYGLPNFTTLSPAITTARAIHNGGAVATGIQQFRRRVHPPITV